jgi:type IV pilus assembly protein PilY1
VTTCTSPANRKFIFGPDVTVDGDTNILLLGSGDREKPLNTANATSNYFFKINDKPNVTSYLTAESANCGSNVMCLNSLLPVTSGTIATTANLAAKKGWYLALQSNEQVVTSAVTVYGSVYFSTHQPKGAVANSCSANLGNTRSYAVLYKNGANPDGSSNVSFTLLTGGGLPPSPVAGKVTLDDGSTVPFIIGAKGPLESMQLTGASSTSNLAKIRSYWYIQK